MIAHAVAVAAAFAAGPTPLLDAPRADSVAVAGNEVIVSRTGARGRLTVDALPVQGGPPRRLLTAAGIAKDWSAFAVVAASTERVAVRVYYAADVSRQRWRLYTGPTSGPLTKVVETGLHGWVPTEPAVDGDRAVVPESRFASRKTRAVLFEGAAAPRVLPQARKINAPVALAGDHLLYAGASGNLFAAGRSKHVSVRLTRAAAKLVRDKNGAVVKLRYHAAGARPSPRWLRSLVAPVS